MCGPISEVFGRKRRQAYANEVVEKLHALREGSDET